MDKVILNAYAKINPFLEITAKRADGYHEIDSVMLSLSLHDTLELTATDGGITLTSDAPCVPTDKRNIAYKVAQKLLDVTKEARGVHIDIKKRIPTEAGMGGGSADGAAVLVGLNRLLGEPLSTDELCRIGASVGADIPFCIRGGCVRVGGIGEVVKETLPTPKFHVLVAKTQEGISTPVAYSALDVHCGDFCNYAPKDPAALILAIKKNALNDISKELYNVFEHTLDELAPHTAKLKTKLAALSSGALLCGSGNAVFAVFENELSASKARDVLLSDPMITFAEVCETKPYGIEFV
jgi:4-diphosphocytidyl-2-C-methyl-D-erythritol kinase